MEFPASGAVTFFLRNFRSIICFCPDKRQKGVLDADVYRLITSSVDANYNAYATLKLSYTFEYGKKVGRSPKYQTGRGESTIIEG